MYSTNMLLRDNSTGTLIYISKANIAQNIKAKPTENGTARNNNPENILLRSSSVTQDPKTKLPPEENGEIADD